MTNITTCCLVLRLAPAPTLDLQEWVYLYFYTSVYTALCNLPVVY